MIPPQVRTAGTTGAPPASAAENEGGLLEARVQAQMSCRLLARLVEHPACIGAAGQALVDELVEIHREARRQLPYDHGWGGVR